MRHWDIVVLSLAAVAATAQSAQIPFGLGDGIQRHQEPVDVEDILNADVDAAKWNLSEPPSPYATGQLIFDTASAFLQHWPNTRLRNGHNIVPGVVAKGTLLYHGTWINMLPKVPEWTATDPEHSWHFCSNIVPNRGCWHLTLVATRPLNVLYFDGSSAAKMDDGPFDTQDLIAYGMTGLNQSMKRERERIRILCDWGKPFGVDGYVRMEMDFEIMLCDFTAGVSVLSFSRLAKDTRWRRAPPSDLPSRPLPPPSNLSDPTEALVDTHEEIWAGHWHNRYPGEKRIRLDYTRLLSFYDTATFPSLVPVRAGQERWFHRLLGISNGDIARGKRELERLLGAPGGSSGVDWEVLLRVVVDRYADRLELLQHVLNTTDESNMLDTAKKAQVQTRVMLTPYILHSAKPDSTATSSHAWAAPVYKLCSTSHTAYIASSAFGALTHSEELLLSAVEETSREICRVVTGMWAEGVESGLDDDLEPSQAPRHADGERVSRLVRQWRSDVESLMHWLDWSVWVKCRPECSIGEECYLPTWPFRGMGWTPGRPPADEIAKPQPTCIPRI